MELYHCQDCPTRRLCLAAGLDATALDALSDCVQPSHPMGRGGYLYRAGDRADACFVVRSGAYKSFVLSPDGDEHITGFHFPGELMGVSGLSTGIHPESTMALETSTACRVHLSEISRLWEIGSGSSLLRMLGGSERLGVEDHVNLSHSGADARLAGFLVGLGRRMQQQGRSATELPLPMSRTDLANHLGMTLESLSRVLGRLGKAGLIRATRTSVTVLQPAQLETLAGHVLAGHFQA